MTIVEHIKKEIKRLEYNITMGKGEHISSRNHLDGFTLKGLQKDLKKLKKCIKILSEWI